MNNSDNSILFFKVWRNITIKNQILSNLKSPRSDYSYNATSSLLLMIENNKYGMVLDKLKMNQYLELSNSKVYLNIHDSLVDSDIRFKIKSIHQLLWNKYSYELKRYDVLDELVRLKAPKSFKESFISCYSLGENGEIINNGLNGINPYYRFYSLIIRVLYEFHLYDYLYISELFEFFNNNNSSNLCLEKLTIEESNLSPENEIIRAIYSNKALPLVSNQYFYSQGEFLLLKQYQQDTIENQFKINIKSLISNSTNSLKLYGCEFNQEILEAIIDRLIIDDSSIIEIHSGKNSLEQHYYIDNTTHAIVYLLNQLNIMIQNNTSNQVDHQIKLFSKSLVKKIDNIEELIRELKGFCLSNIELKNRLGPFYIYYKLKQQQQQEILELVSSRDKYFLLLVLYYSIINQSVNSFIFAYQGLKDIDLEIYTKFVIFESNKVGSNIGHDKDIKMKLIELFNQLLLFNDNKDYSKINQVIWFIVFRVIIINYEANIFEWLLKEFSELKQIYYKTVKDHFPKMFGVHINLNKLTNQIDYCWVDLFFKYLLVFGDGGSIDIDKKLIVNDSKRKKERNILLLKYLIKNPENRKNCFISKVVELILENFKDNFSTDELLSIYNQIDQQQLFSFYKDTLYSIYKNKTIILVDLLVQYIVHLDFKSVIKIISAVLNNSSSNNNNINISSTIDNSLDLIKYLFNNNYLKQFNLVGFFKKVLDYIIIPKKFIVQLIQDQDFQIKNQFEDLFKVYFRDEEDYIELYCYELDFENQEIEEEVEILKSKLNKRINSKKSIYKWVKKIISKGYYQMAYDYLTENELIYEHHSSSEALVFSKRSIPIEWFEKLYPLFFNRLLDGEENFISIVGLFSDNIQVFEFVWCNHYSSDQEKKKFIFCLFNMYKRINLGYLEYTNQSLVKYIMDEKEHYLILVLQDMNHSQLLEFLKYHLINSSYSMFKKLKSIIGSSVKDGIKVVESLVIDFEIIRQLIEHDTTRIRYDVLEYLFKDNLIPNLFKIIGKDYLDKLKILEYNYNSKNLSKKKNYKNNGNQDYISILITKSMFILIHTIIKLQQEQQQ